MRNFRISAVLALLLLLVAGGALAQTTYNSNWTHQLVSAATTCTGATGNFPSMDSEDTPQCSANVNVTVLTGTAPQLIFRLQGSLDNTTFYDLTPAQTAITAAPGNSTFSLIAGARHLRVAWTTAGTVTTCTATAFIGCKR